MAKTLAGVLAVSIAALLFAGCGRSGTTTASTSVTTPDPPQLFQCEKVPTRYPPDSRPPTITGASFELGMSECRLDYTTFYVTGWVRNSGESNQSYLVRIQAFQKGTDLRLGSWSKTLGDLPPDTRAQWTLPIWFEGDQRSSDWSSRNNWVFTVSVEEQ
jgi:hypothetical protein